MSTQEKYWEFIEGNPIVAIEASPSHPESPGRAAFAWISFHIEGHSLSLTINQDTDEIVVDIEAAEQAPRTDPQIASVLHELVGKEFCWLWNAQNSHGYLDTVMMSFFDPAADDNGEDGPVAPQIAFVGVASTIQLFRLVSADD
jgi:hypothetical protein